MAAARRRLATFPGVDRVVKRERFNPPTTQNGNPVLHDEVYYLQTGTGT